MMLKLNPWAKEKAALIAKLDKERQDKRKATLKAKRGKAGRKDKKTRSDRY